MGARRLERLAFPTPALPSEYIFPSRVIIYIGEACGFPILGDASGVYGAGAIIGYPYTGYQDIELPGLLTRKRFRRKGEKKVLRRVGQKRY